MYRRMYRIARIVLTGAALAGLAATPSFAQGQSWAEFFQEYCASGSNTCLPTAQNGYRLGKTVQETVDDITAFRAGAIPMEKFSIIAAVGSYQDFLDRVNKLGPEALNRGQAEFKAKPDALLAKFAAIRAECNAVVSLPDRRTCYEQAMTAIIPGRKQ